MRLEYCNIEQIVSKYYLEKAKCNNIENQDQRNNNQLYKTYYSVKFVCNSY